jgi:thiamine biosynthesis protein ThiS
MSERAFKGLLANTFREVKQRRFAAGINAKRMMNIVFNGQVREVADDATVAALIAQLDLNPSYIAVEVNRELVPRQQHAACRLSEGDHVELVTLVGGG